MKLARTPGGSLLYQETARKIERHYLDYLEIKRAWNLLQIDKKIEDQFPFPVTFETYLNIEQDWL